MTEIRLESGQVERIVAQVLRDEFKMLPATANNAARSIGKRLLCSLPTPGTSSLRGTKLIGSTPDQPFYDEFSQMMKESGMSARTAWDLVYDHCRPVPAVVADAVNY
jgi:hypothetical protein